jgi:hypothetical protein
MNTINILKTHLPGNNLDTYSLGGTVPGVGTVGHYNPATISLDGFVLDLQARQNYLVSAEPVLEGGPIERDEQIGFDCQRSWAGTYEQFQRAIACACIGRITVTS